MFVHPTRESWLLSAVQMIEPIFKEKGHVVPVDCQVSCGFPSTGSKSHVGQCWSRKSSIQEKNQIFISPALSDPVTVLDTLVHELVHAVDDCRNKHGKEFKKIALSVGLEGKMRSASAGKELITVLEKIAAQLGEYPHAGLVITHSLRFNPPRPRARCEDCGYEVPMYKKFLSFGPPLCPKHRTEMKQIGEWEQD